MNLKEKIIYSEQHLLQSLEEFFTGIYEEKKLPSHGLEHHRRVWKYAKELLQYIDKEDKGSDPLFINKILIACYLHDIGIAIDPGTRHGFHSSNLCEQFLLKKGLNVSDYQDVLRSIENHDNKEYADSYSNNKLMLLLSVADDLDAFGYMGIYRYIEIYLARGVQPEMIGKMVRENSEKRFKNFEFNFGRYKELVEKHRKRYFILDSFFKEFSKEIDGNR